MAVWLRDDRCLCTSLIRLAAWETGLYPSVHALSRPSWRCCRTVCGSLLWLVIFMHLACPVPDRWERSELCLLPFSAWGLDHSCFWWWWLPSRKTSAQGYLASPLNGLACSPCSWHLASWFLVPHTMSSGAVLSFYTSWRQPQRKNGLCLYQASVELSAACYHPGNGAW